VPAEAPAQEQTNPVRGWGTGGASGVMDKKQRDQNVEFSDAFGQLQREVLWSGSPDLNQFGEEGSIQFLVSAVNLGSGSQ
jgi:hypothetical protein